MNSTSLSPSQRILHAIAPEEALVEITLTTQFGESLPIPRLLEFWQINGRVHALLAAARANRLLLLGAVPEAIAGSDLYRALVATSVGFVVQFAALGEARDAWGRQALLAAPRGATGLWRALVWAGTGRGPWSLVLAQAQAVSAA